MRSDDPLLEFFAIMAMNINDNKVEQLAEELSRLTGESKIVVILHALEERKERLSPTPSGKRPLAQVLDFLEKEVWPNIPPDLRGRGITKEEREQILGYGRGGV
ncbi:MAG: type II toxin-antitoxin system VapB family antitoxin [Thermoanaerobaculia bacterium]